MVKSESDMIFKPRTGQVITAENGTQYFVCGNKPNCILSKKTGINSVEAIAGG